MDLDLAAIASSGNLEIAGLTVVAWFLKSLIGVATKTYTAFAGIEAKGDLILAEVRRGNDQAAENTRLQLQQGEKMLEQQNKQTDILQQILQSNKDIIDSNHEISNILLYNIPPRKVVEKNVANV